MLLVALLIASFAAAVAAWRFTPVPWWAAWMAAASLCTWAAYGIDKLQARSSRRRIAERTLHAASLLGGAAGGWAGMLMFRHKTRHKSFWAVLALATIVQVAAAVWLLR